MLIWVVRRAAQMALLFVAVSVLAFTLIQLAPGEFLDEARLSPQISGSTLDALRQRYGLTEPATVRYGHWFARAIQGNLGISLAYNQPVMGLIAPRAANTLLLSGVGALAAWVVALPWAIWAARKPGGAVDRSSAVAVGALLAMPDMVLALALILVAIRTGWFPAGGRSSGASGAASAVDLLRHLALPATSLALATMPVVFRHARSSLAQTLQAPFVAAARAHGIPPLRLLYRHVLPAAANPLISLLGVVIGGLLSSSLLVEVIFGWPGLGPLLFDAVMARDAPLVLGCVLVCSLFVASGVLAADVLLYAADPRIRLGGESR